MEETAGAQYAIQIAVHTLRDRCRTLQQRIADLEEENLNLKITCSLREQDNESLSEIDRLRQQVAEVSEQKTQIQNSFDMVSQENKELWKKLSKLTKVNKSLGTQLNKISDTLSNHTTTNLIRSKTFTQHEPTTKVLQRNLEENDRVSLELENISLKLIDSFSKEKQELEAIYSEIKDLQAEDNIVTENFAFYYDAIDDDIFNDFVNMLEELKQLKEESAEQQDMLRCLLRNLKDQELNRIKIENVDKSTSMDTSPVDINHGSIVESESSRVPNSPNPIDKICPVCSKEYGKNSGFEEFQQHVEEHFTDFVAL